MEQRVARPAADDVKVFYALTGQLLDPAEHGCVHERETFQTTANERAFRVRNWLARVAAVPLARGRHVSRAQKARVVRVDERCEWRRGLGQLNERGVVAGFAA